MKKVKVAKSKIHGKGLFTMEPVKKGELILPVHSGVPIDQNKTRFIPNTFGKFYNHDDKNFNVSNEIIGDKRYLRAIKNIPANSELTANYREHSEMEQPEDFGNTKYASFDFDKTIATPEGLAMAKKMFRDGYNLFIVSARDKVTPDMVARAKQAGIPIDNIIATGSDEAKVKKVKQLGVEKHFDDKPEVIAALGSVGQQFRKGGGVNTKKYTRSIFGKNKLFVKNKLFKPKKVKNRIYDPNAKYYEDGGNIDNKIYIPKLIEGGLKPCGPGQKWDPVLKKCVLAIEDRSVLNLLQREKYNMLGIGDKLPKSSYNPKFIKKNPQYKKDDYLTQNLKEVTITGKKRNPLLSEYRQLLEEFERIKNSPLIADQERAKELFGQIKDIELYNPGLALGTPRRESFEDNVNYALDNPMSKASVSARSLGESDEDEIDNFRHPQAGRYAAEAIMDYFPEWLQYTGMPQISGFLGANALGIGHEASIFFNDDRPLLIRARESAEDIFNNAVGAGVGVLPIDPKNKTDLLLNLSYENKLPDGYGELDVNGYFKKNAKDKGKFKYETGGIILDIPESEIQKYIDGGYTVEEIDDPSIPVLNSYKGGGNIAEQWEDITGTSWSEAKKKGLTDGSYDQNIKLQQRLLSGEFGEPKVSVIKDDSHDKRYNQMVAALVDQGYSLDDLVDERIGTREGLIYRFPELFANKKSQSKSSQPTRKVSAKYAAGPEKPGSFSNLMTGAIWNTKTYEKPKPKKGTSVIQQYKNLYDILSPYASKIGEGLSNAYDSWIAKQAKIAEEEKKSKSKTQKVTPKKESIKTDDLNPMFANMLKGANTSVPALTRNKPIQPIPNSMASNFAQGQNIIEAQARNKINSSGNLNLPEIQPKSKIGFKDWDKTDIGQALNYFAQGEKPNTPITYNLTNPESLNENPYKNIKGEGVKYNDILDRQLKDYTRYRLFPERGQDIMNRTDVKRNRDSELFFADHAGANSVIIDIGSGLGNSNPALAGVSTYELASNPNIKKKNIKVIATDIPSEIKTFKKHGKTALPLDVESIPMSFNYDVSNILNKRKLGNVNTVYLRAANSIDLLMSPDQMQTHFKNLSQNLYNKEVYYVFNNTILKKLPYNTEWIKIGNINNAAYNHETPEWKQKPDRIPYNLISDYKIGGSINTLQRFISGGNPGDDCGEGFTYVPKLGCVPLSEENLTENQKWMIDWYKNRKIEFPEGEKVFRKDVEKALPAYNPESPMLQQMEAFPAYLPIPEEYMNDKVAGITAAGMYDNTGKYPKIYFSPNLNDEQRSDTEIHELTNHFMEPVSDKLYPTYSKIVEENIIPFDENWPKEKQDFYDYIIDPDDQNIQSYLNVARKKFNLKPDEVITPERINKMKKEAEEKGMLDQKGKNFNQDIYLLFKMAKDNESLMKLFNLIAKNEGSQDIQYGKYGGEMNYELGDTIQGDDVKEYLESMGYTLEEI